MYLGFLPWEEWNRLGLFNWRRDGGEGSERERAVRRQKQQLL